MQPASNTLTSQKEAKAAEQCRHALVENLDGLSNLGAELCSTATPGCTAYHKLHAFEQRLGQKQIQTSEMHETFSMAPPDPHTAATLSTHANAT